jgi:hypothetical protein
MVLSDQAKIYNTLEKLVDELGLKDIQPYFNNPAMPAEVLQAQNEQLQGMVQELGQQAQQNPLAEAEMIKVQGSIATKQLQEENKMQQFVMKMAQGNDEFSANMRLEIEKLAQSGNQFAADLAKDLTDMELKYNTDVPGAVI